MEKDERSKINWYFPINKQMKQAEKQKRQSNRQNEFRNDKANKKNYTQTKLICCRP